jgi:hypothetical protein
MQSVQQPIRQGDVILVPMEQPIVGGDRLDHLTLAEGEISGHRHRISEGEATLFADGDLLYLQVESDRATLSHEEHRRIDIPRGTWVVRIQRQYEPGDWSYIDD